MARITSVGSVVIRQMSRTNSAGGTGYYVNDAMAYTKSTLNRADIVRNPPSTSGSWRKPLPYNAELTMSACGDCYHEVTQDGFTYREIGKMGSNTTWPTFAITAAMLNGVFPSQSDQDAAVVRARNNVADRVASFGESLAELIKTLDGLKDLASKIDRFIIAATAKDYDAVADSLGIPRKIRKHRRAIVRYNKMGIPTVSNAFLCWNFGLFPIISDMVALAVAMGEGKPLRITGKGEYKTRANQKHNVPVSYELAIPYVGVPYTVNYLRMQKAAVRVRLDYEVSIERLRDLTSFGLLDAPATVWALVPYSFLVDFVLPVSEVLRSLTATFGLTFKGGSATRYVRISDSFQNVVYPRKEDILYCTHLNLRGSADDIEGMKMVRSVFETDPNPVTLWIKDPLSAFSAATVFSLLGQKLGAASRVTKNLKI